MGIVLYKPGKTKTVRGIQCDAKVFDDKFYESNLDLGWFLSPEACYQEQQVEEQKTEILDAIEVDTWDEDFDDEVISQMDEDEVRATAKKAGIKNWYNKGLDKLKIELEELDG